MPALAGQPALLVARKRLSVCPRWTTLRSSGTKPENPPVYPLEQVFEVEGEQFVVPDEPLEGFMADPGERGNSPQASGDSAGVVEFLPMIWSFFRRARRVRLWWWSPPRGPVAAGTLRLAAPAGWQVSPATQSFFAAGGRAERPIYFHHHRAAAKRFRRNHRLCRHARRKLGHAGRIDIRITSTFRRNCSNHRRGSRR